MPILTDEERAGTTIAGGKYTIEHVLGRGGMGTVFAGTHNWTGRSVAIKLLRHDLATSPDAGRRYLQEARATAAIEHPNVVEVLDMGSDADGSVYLVFERLRGESLADWLDRAGRLSAYEVAETLLPVLDGLAVAHRLGIVHRDLKPENIFLVDDGEGNRRPKLLDFGIAKVDDAGTSRTRTGQVVGTPVYMSPEQAQGSREILPASDVWSMGILLYECLTGYPPFESTNTTGVLLAIVSHPVPSLRECRYVPEPIADVVDRALTRDVTRRYPDAGALRDALAVAAGIEFVPARGKSEPPKVVRLPTASSECITLDGVIELSRPAHVIAPERRDEAVASRRGPTRETDPALAPAVPPTPSTRPTRETDPALPLLPIARPSAVRTASLGLVIGGALVLGAWLLIRSGTPTASTVLSARPRGVAAPDHAGAPTSSTASAADEPTTPAHADALPEAAATPAHADALPEAAATPALPSTFAAPVPRPSAVRSAVAPRREHVRERPLVRETALDAPAARGRPRPERGANDAPILD